MEYAHITERSQVSSDVYRKSATFHEAGHLAGMLAFGATPHFVAIGGDKNSAASGGVGFSIANTDFQNVGIISKLGVAAEERYYAELGFTEASHPEFVRDMRSRSGWGDEAWIDSVAEQNPHVVLDKDRAWADARMLVANPEFWNLTKLLAKESGDRIYMEEGEIKEVSAHMSPETLLAREGLQTWRPGADQVRRTQEEAESKSLVSGETPKSANRDKAEKAAEEVRRKAKERAQEELKSQSPQRGGSSGDSPPMTPSSLQSAIQQRNGSAANPSGAPERTPRREHKNQSQTGRGLRS